MGVELTAGTRLRSAACDAEVVVVAAPSGEVALRCGGHPMLPVDQDRPDGVSITPGFDDGVQIGKRYASESGDLELLCTKAGDSSLQPADLGQHGAWNGLIKVCLGPNNRSGSESELIAQERRQWEATERLDGTSHVG